MAFGACTEHCVSEGGYAWWSRPWADENTRGANNGLRDIPSAAFRELPSERRRCGDEWLRDRGSCPRSRSASFLARANCSGCQHRRNGMPYLIPRPFIPLLKRAQEPAQRVSDKTGCAAHSVKHSPNVATSTVPRAICITETLGMRIVRLIQTLVGVLTGCTVPWGSVDVLTLGQERPRTQSESRHQGKACSADAGKSLLPSRHGCPPTRDEFLRSLDRPRELNSQSADMPATAVAQHLSECGRGSWSGRMDRHVGSGAPGRRGVTRCLSRSRFRRRRIGDCSRVTHPQRVPKCDSGASQWRDEPLSRTTTRPTGGASSALRADGRPGRTGYLEGAGWLGNFRAGRTYGGGHELNNGEGK